MSKNLFWWFSLVPFLVTNGNIVDAIRNTVVVAFIAGVYYWRARTEEKHLSVDPAYREYAEWMERNAPIPRLIRWLSAREDDPAPAAAASARLQVPRLRGRAWVPARPERRLAASARR